MKKEKRQYAKSRIDRQLRSTASTDSLLARHVTSESLGLEPVEDDKNAIASCRIIS